KTLLDDVLLVLLSHLRLAHLDQLDDPARIEIDHKTDPAAMLRQVLDCQTQSTRAGWSKREPVSAAREELFRESVAERFVVDAKVVNINTRLRHARAAAGFK